MSSKIVLIASAIVLFATGLILNFAPDETAAWLAEPSTGLVRVLLQLLGAAFMGFAFLNWFSRANMVGGIYGRPLALANLFFFAVAAMVLVRGAHGSHPLSIAAAVSAVLAAAFGWRMFFADPVTEQANKAEKE